MSEKDEPIRWEVGERIAREATWAPGFFLFFWAGVLAWKWTARSIRRAAARLAAAVGKPQTLRLPPPLKALPPPRAEDRPPWGP